MSVALPVLAKRMTVLEGRCEGLKADQSIHNDVMLKTAERVKKNSKRLKHLTRLASETRVRVQSLEEVTSDTSARVERLEVIATDTSARVQGLEQDVSTLKQDVSTLKQDVSTLKQDVKRLDRGVQALVAHFELVVPEEDS